MRGEPLAGHDAQVVLNVILAHPGFEGWRGFMDGHYAFLESPHVAITRDDMDRLSGFYVDQIGAVFRSLPNAGVYLRCRLLDPRDPVDPSWNIKYRGGSF